MNPDVGLCPHLASQQISHFAIEPSDIVEHYDGPVVAVTRCEPCARAGLLQMLDWSRDLRVRVYALAGLEVSAFELFLRNLSRGSCDAQRAALELEALLASAGPVERLLAMDSRALTVVASRAWPRDAVLPGGSWQMRIPEPSDSRWFDYLALGKEEPAP